METWIEAVTTHGFVSALLLIYGLITAACLVLRRRVGSRSSRWLLGLVASLPLVVVAILIAQKLLSWYVGNDAERYSLYNYNNQVVVAVFLTWGILCSVVFLLTARSVHHHRQ